MQYARIDEIIMYHSDYILITRVSALTEAYRREVEFFIARESRIPISWTYTLKILLTTLLVEKLDIFYQVRVYSMRR